MKRKAAPIFNPKVFLAKVGKGDLGGIQKEPEDFLARGPG
jgi:hypothetical protein